MTDKTPEEMFTRKKSKLKINPSKNPPIKLIRSEDTGVHKYKYRPNQVTFHCSNCGKEGKLDNFYCIKLTTSKIIGTNIDGETNKIYSINQLEQYSHVLHEVDPVVKVEEEKLEWKPGENTLPTMKVMCSQSCLTAHQI